MAKRKAASEQLRPQGLPMEQLRVFGDPTLRQQTRVVTEFDARLERLSLLMLEVMEREDGVGLAAPQVGVLSRIMVWRDPESETERHVFVNPAIAGRSESCTAEMEGCLSVPGCSMEVSRADEVLVQAQDLGGASFEMRLSGLLARIVQHEIDHLDGLLILDRTSQAERRRVLKEMRERITADGT